MFLRRLLMAFAVFFLLISLTPLSAQNRFTVVKGRLAISWGDMLDGTKLEAYAVNGEDGHTYQLDLNDTQKAQLGY